MEPERYCAGSSGTRPRISRCERRWPRYSEGPTWSGPLACTKERDGDEKEEGIEAPGYRDIDIDILYIRYIIGGIDEGPPIIDLKPSSAPSPRSRPVCGEAAPFPGLHAVISCFSPHVARVDPAMA